MQLHILLSSSVAGSSSVSSRFRKAVEEYEQSLSEDEVVYINSVKHLSHDEIISQTSALLQEYETSIPSLYSNVSSVFEKVRSFSPVIDVLAQAHTVSGIVWGRSSQWACLYVYSTDHRSQGSFKFILEVCLTALMIAARSMALTGTQDKWSFQSDAR